MLLLTEISEALANRYTARIVIYHFNLKSPRQKLVLAIYNIVARTTNFIWCSLQQGCAASGSISKEDAAFVCVAAFDCVPQTGFIFEVANGDNKVSDWKECLATLMEETSQKLQWLLTGNVYPHWILYVQNVYPMRKESLVLFLTLKWSKLLLSGCNRIFW